jgi:hypothetical protein
MRKHVIILVALLSLGNIQAQVKNTEKTSESKNLKFKLKDNANPDIYVDGKKFDFPLSLIDQDKIESGAILSEEEALKKYNAPNGVILITTKKSMSSQNSESLPENGDPLMLIDGKVSSKADVQKLSPENIVSVNVIKGEEGLKKYNAPNGVVLIITKKK